MDFTSSEEDRREGRRVASYVPYLSNTRLCGAECKSVPRSGRSGANRESDPRTVAEMGGRMEKASRRGRSGCVLGDIAKTTKPLFFLSHFVDFGVK